VYPDLKCGAVERGDAIVVLGIEVGLLLHKNLGNGVVALHTEPFTSGLFYIESAAMYQRKDRTLCVGYVLYVSDELIMAAASGHVAVRASNISDIRQTFIGVIASGIPRRAVAAYPDLAASPVKRSKTILVGNVELSARVNKLLGNCDMALCSGLWAGWDHDSM
jgi:hypothetical protein